MPNGKPGDHPINDIVDHGRAVFSPEVDELVREIARLAPRDRMWDLVDWFSLPPLRQLEANLRAHLDGLRAEHESERGDA